MIIMYIDCIMSKYLLLDWDLVTKMLRKISYNKQAKYNKLGS